MVKIQLHPSVMMTETARKVLSDLGVTEYEDFSIVGQIVKRRTVDDFVAMRFHLKYVYKGDVPVLSVEDFVTLTLSKDVALCVVPEPSGAKVLKLREPSKIEGVCFQAGEEIVISACGESSLMVGNGVTMRIKQAFLDELKEVSYIRRLYRVITYAEGMWTIMGAFAYNEEDLYTSIPNLRYFTRDFLPVGTYNEATLLAVLKSTNSPTDFVKGTHE